MEADGDQIMEVDSADVVPKAPHANGTPVKSGEKVVENGRNHIDEAEDEKDSNSSM